MYHVGRQQKEEETSEIIEDLLQTTNDQYYYSVSGRTPLTTYIIRYEGLSKDVVGPRRGQHRPRLEILVGPEEAEIHLVVGFGPLGLGTNRGDGHRIGLVFVL